MPLPSTVVFAAGDLTYIAALNQMIADLNATYNAFLLTQTGSLFVGTSATSVLIATGSKSFVVAESGARAWAIGSALRIASSASPTNYMDGQVTAYAHPNVTINVSSVGGAGTLAAWTIGPGAGATAITGLAVGGGTANQTIEINAAGSAVVGVNRAATAMTDEVAAYLYN